MRGEITQVRIITQSYMLMRVRSESLIRREQMKVKVKVLRYLESRITYKFKYQRWPLIGFSLGASLVMAQQDAFTPAQGSFILLTAVIFAFQYRNQ